MEMGHTEESLALLATDLQQSQTSHPHSLDDSSVDDYKNQMLQAIPEDERITNATLREKLGWVNDDIYWFIRDKLVDDGLLRKRQGRGGAVEKVGRVGLNEAVESTVVQVPQEVPRLTEVELYEPIRSVLAREWARDQRLGSVIVENTSQQGRRVTGGTWTRPDLTLLSMRTFAYLPGRSFDVITFEIKPSDKIDVTAVYEALSHRRAATRSYVLLHVPNPETTEAKESLRVLIEEAERWGIGVISVGTPSDYSSWETHADASRHEPDPERLNDFLATQISDTAKEQLVHWFK